MNSPSESVAQKGAPADVFARRSLFVSPKLTRGKNAAELGRWAWSALG